MKYRAYSALDFANDGFFIRWVKNPDEESDWFWKSFMEENPSRRPEVEKAIELILLLEFPTDHLSDEELGGMRNGLFMALHAEREEQRSSRSGRIVEFTRTHKWLKSAAAIIVIPLSCSGVFFFMKKSEKALPALRTDKMAGTEIRVNPVGQKSVLFLSDGTKVWLNAASKISYARDFNEHDIREVYLEGEAFFDVTHNKKRPFIVHASTIKIKVLGTSFNVKSYSEEKTIETTLVHGKVRIEQSDVKGNRVGDIELKPNQCAVFNKESKVIKIKEVVADNSGSWKQERLVFDEEPIDNVILRMERWYNVKIHTVNRGHLDCKLTATIEKESLEEVLKLIETSYSIRFRIEGSDVYIEGTLCKPEPK